ncbi:hypothetical protein ZYGR_0N06740 [Zygosaccharomyces rouxii]|uniref:Protein FAF1 n=1 Tax=Zygosaccharomyces rouxii TaxID=4956 RepID=A0A1Q3A0Q7_ZYGRO|nr:hypothetical protein ZYGR_0N06740 [Zygosaccharomyces rouxii]
MSDDYAKMLEQQRRAFEAQFGSLESMGFEDKTKNIDNESSDEESSSQESFKGFSEKEDESDEELEEEEEEDDDDDEENLEGDKYTPSVTRSAPKVIKFQDPSGTYEPPSKKEQKLLRSGKPLRDTPLNNKDSKPESDSDSDLEHQNIKNDVELQKFLHESHLLSALDPSTEPNAQIHGKSRARALEMHLNHLSTTNGNSPKLEKVPMHVRKGMINKHLHKIQRHEEEAKDAGIILSRTKKGQFRRIESTYKNDIERRIGTTIKTKEKQRKARRQRGLKVQSVGKSTRHGLKISPKDIDRISKS